MKLKKIVTVLIVTCVVVVGIVIYYRVSATSVNSFTVKEGEICEYVDGRGKVKLDGYWKIFGNFSGVVQSINVSEGDEVEASTILLKFNSEDSDISLKKAQEAYNSSLASLEDLKQSIKPEEIEQARLGVEQEKITLDNAEKDYSYKKDILDKTKVLFLQGAATEQAVKDAENVADLANDSLGKAKVGVEIAEEKYNLLQKGVSENAIKASDANSEQTKLAYEEQKLDNSRTIIYSGVQGTVLSKNVQSGQVVQKGDTLLEIGDYNTAYISVDVLTDDARKINKGQKAIITGDALGKEQIEGEIYYIAPKANDSVSSLGVEEQKIEVRIRCNKGILEVHNIKPNTGLDVKLITEDKNAIYVPYKSVFELDNVKNVFVIENGKLNLKQVKTGIENDNQIEIINGISVNDNVVSNPSNDMKNGTRVKVE